MKYAIGLLAAGLALLLAVAGTSSRAAAGPTAAPPHENAVVVWSRLSQAAISAPSPGSTALRPPAGAQVLQGIVHAAIYDAVVAIEGGSEPFVTSPSFAHPASVDAAVATAAHDVLVARVPAQASSVDDAYDAYLESIHDGQKKLDNGIALGRKVANAILEWRAGDGFDNNVRYVQPAPGPGVFEPVAAPGQTPGEPVDVKLKQVRPLTFASYVPFRPDGPPALSSPEYARDFNEVKTLGRADSTVRTPAQTDVARFWSENAFTQYSRNLANIAVAQKLNVRESARLLALAHVTAADTVISCYSSKYHYLFWRPVNAVKRADTDGNPATEADPTWESLLVVNHPEYPSGHSCWSTALAEVLTDFFGTDRVRFTINSTVPNLTSPVHTFTRFSDLPKEVYDARVWAGIHYRFSDVDGAKLGREVAQHVINHYFEPTK